jgi:D-tagatose-1,6-bisphosphate aldolase subunit GatZ/KbaZ
MKPVTMKPVTSMADIIASQKRGRPLGIYSICSINRRVIEAAIEQARADDSLLLIESTCNQVNQFGGYSGLTPSDFRASIESITAAHGFPFSRVILGGDHLGPFPFRAEKAADAMSKACEMVRGYVGAGFSKIHLDPSMRLADDPGPPGSALDPRVVAERCAELCKAAEDAVAQDALSRGSRAGAAAAPSYVIGSDVPTPGGSDEVESGIHITTTEELEQTIDLIRQSFLDKGLREAWERVIAVVVQPGVEHGDHTILEYDRARAAHLARSIRKHPGLVFEGHTTDYQTPRALCEMVQDGIAILKVGPSLTGALREAVFLLARIEEDLLTLHPTRKASGIARALDSAMLANPIHWKSHYTGDERQVTFSRAFSLLDRIRYYWNVPEVEASMSVLMGNLASLPIPGALLSQFLPAQYARVREGTLPNDPESIVRDRIKDVLGPYSQAVGNSAAG